MVSELWHEASAYIMPAISQVRHPRHGATVLDTPVTVPLYWTPPSRCHCTAKMEGELPLVPRWREIESPEGRQFRFRNKSSSLNADSLIGAQRYHRDHLALESATHPYIVMVSMLHYAL